MYWASGSNPIAHTRSPSSKSKGKSEIGGSSSEVSSDGSGNGPVRQALMPTSSFLELRLSVRSSFLHPTQHLGRHRVISTFPVLQSISGLCSLSQVIPSIIFCLPRLVTENKARSECLSYRMINSTTSKILLASFAVPSTLNTGIGRESFLVRSQLDFTYSRSINSPVAPQSTRAQIPCFRWVSVLSISI
jgi:hypothetical protein